MAKTPATTKKEKKKVADKFAYARGDDGALVDQVDYTQARIACYKSVWKGEDDKQEIDPEATISEDFSPQYDAMIAGGVSPELAGMTIACAIEGWLNKASHATNKARNSNSDTTEAEELRAYQETLRGGGWTNREGGNEINAKFYWQAYAEMKNSDPESVQMRWQGNHPDGRNYTDADKTAIRRHPQVQEIVKRLQWEAARDKNRGSTAAGGDSDLPVA